MNLHFFSAFKNSLSGLHMAWAEDDSFRRAVWQVLAAFVVAGAFYGFDVVSAEQLAILIIAQCPIVIVELINCAIEAVTDKASPGYSLLAKKAKDIASATVLMTRLMVLLIWVVVLIHALT